ncbi:MAG: TonB-dependent receptor [Archangium sp.]|nr:TonB-dependent receptor [Archangium sp.]
MLALVLALSVGQVALDAGDDQPLDAGAEVELAPHPDPLPASQGEGVLLSALSGVVETRGTREAIPLAEVVLRDGGEVLAQTDADGTFSFSTDAGVLQLTVRAAGFLPLDVTETLEPNQRVEVKYRLERVDTGWETIVRARRDEGPSRVELSRVELQEIAGTMGDPFRVTMLLPGVSSIASGLSYPVVRGAQPAATGFFLDGVRVPQLYHLLAGPAVVHPDFIEKVDFFPGVLPARLGRLLGGAIDGRLAKPSSRVQVTASLDVLNAGAFVSVPIDPLHLHVTVAGRVSYAGPLAAAIAKGIFPSTPESPVPTPVVDFGDYQARVGWTAPDGARVRALVLGVIDEAGVKQNGPGTFTALLTSQFHRADLSYRRATQSGQLEVGITAGLEKLGLLGERDGATFGQFLMGRQSFAGRVRWEGTLTDSLELSLGLEAERQSTSFEIDRDPSAKAGPAASFREPATLGALVGAFAELQWKYGRLTSQLGFRFDGYFLDEGPVPHPTSSAQGPLMRFAPEPRVFARYTLTNDIGLRAGASLVHQAPTVLLNLPVTDLAGLRDGLKQAVKTEVGADVLLPFGFEGATSVFWNQITRPIEYSLEDLLGNRSRLSTAATQGRAYGFEVMVRRRPEGRWFGWLSYTFQRSERLRNVIDFDATGRVLDTSARWVPFEFDQSHVLHVTGGVVLPLAIHVSVGVHFNTGRPESGVVSSRAMREGLDPATLLPAWVPDSLSNEPRLPAFARIDARIARTWTFEAFTLEVFLDVFNASVTREVLGYTYETLPAGDTRVLRRSAFSIPAVLPFLGAKARY